MELYGLVHKQNCWYLLIFRSYVGLLEGIPMFGDYKSPFRATCHAWLTEAVHCDSSPWGRTGANNITMGL